MVGGPVVRLALSDDGVVGALLALQRAAYAVEAELVGSDAIPNLRETADELRSCGETFVGVMEGGEVVAALAYEETPELLDISRLVVAPARSRRRLGQRLVCWVLDAVPRPTTIVSTGSKNEPAIALYRKLGFVAVRESEPVPGLPVTHFEWRR